MPKRLQFGSQTVTPPKIFCVGRNYAKHAEELGNPIPDDLFIFIKSNYCITRKLVIPDTETRYEGEICFLLKEKKIVGVGFGLDLTKVAVQKVLKEKRLPWEKAKAFPHSAVLSDFVPVDSWEGLAIKVYVNDELRQDSDVSMMLFKPDFVVSELEKYYELEDEDVIMSGTPEGVGQIHPGDVVRGEIYRDGDCLLSVTFS